MVETAKAQFKISIALAGATAMGFALIACTPSITPFAAPGASQSSVKVVPLPHSSKSDETKATATPLPVPTRADGSTAPVAAPYGANSPEMVEKTQSMNGQPEKKSVSDPELILQPENHVDESAAKTSNLQQGEPSATPQTK